MWQEEQRACYCSCGRKYVGDRKTKVEGAAVEVVEGPDNGMNDLLDAWAELELRGGINKEAAMVDFVGVVSEVITDGALTLEEIVADVSALEEEVSDVGDQTINEEVVESCVNQQEAQSVLNIVRRFVEMNFDDPAILKASDTLDEAFYHDRKKNQKQSKLTDFFATA